MLLRHLRDYDMMSQCQAYNLAHTFVKSTQVNLKPKRYFPSFSTGGGAGRDFWYCVNSCVIFCFYFLTSK